MRNLGYLVLLPFSKGLSFPGKEAIPLLQVPATFPSCSLPRQQILCLTSVRLKVE